MRRAKSVRRASIRSEEEDEGRDEGGKGKRDRGMGMDGHFFSPSTGGEGMYSNEVIISYSRGQTSLNPINKLIGKNQ